MSRDVDRILGKLEEFKETTASRLDRIDEKLEHLNEFKWRIIGGASAVSAIVTIAMHVVVFKH